MNKLNYVPDYLFEVSWEVCNKIGGIHPVLSSKAKTIVDEYKDRFILIGPDVWKETRDNPEFTEDKFLFRSWKRFAESQGLKFKVGRWNIPGNPIVILIDFTPYFSQKDKVFYDFWEKYKLDSLSGGWDYIEPSMFGYAAAKVIENYYIFNLSAHDKISAHFHEWMTGTGVLYLNQNIPQIATIFTSHSTVLGRNIAAVSNDFHVNMKKIDPMQSANQLNLNAKHSLEYIAANTADAFTVISERAGIEANHFLNKNSDVITPNGFGNFEIPEGEDYVNAVNRSKNKLFNVAEALLNQQIEKDSLLLLHSGLYDYKNKGTDIFISVLEKLAEIKDLPKTILAYVMVPINNSGPRTDLLERIHNCDFNNPFSNQYLTHILLDEQSNPLMNRIKHSSLTNNPDSKVKIVISPCFMNGEDGIFNMHYYDLLIGFDLSLFPYYYEPWGYTSLESLAFKVPSIISSLSGFGDWAKENIDKNKKTLCILDRNDENSSEFIDNVVNCILKHFSLSNEDKNTIIEESSRLISLLDWKVLINYYKTAWSVAGQKALSRYEQYKNKKIPEQYKFIESSITNRPSWKKVFIKSFIPEKLMPLQEISRNIWWSWNYDAQELFEMIDSAMWDNLGRNPIALLESLTYGQFENLINNNSFMDKLNKVYSDYKAYINTPVNNPDKLIAYFSMEYGLHDTIKIYSGGLGVLAGDYLKEASDLNVNMVGVGLLYRYGYFTQSLSVHGDQVANYIPQKFSSLPFLPVRNDKNEWIIVPMAFPGRNVYAKAWMLQVGRIKLYLLDTDIPENNEADRAITHQLYGGDWENRLKQEIILGIGGVRMLQTLGYKPTLYHCNEGHAALMVIERMKNFIEKFHFSFYEAKEIVRSSTLFTTHTPVPAGHDAFTEEMLRGYISHFAEKMNIEWKSLVGLGRVNENDPYEKFSMSILATRLSQETNGVSRIHGKVTREMFNNLWEGYFPSELHIGYVTNGVHFPTWVSRSWLDLYKEYLDNDIINKQSDFTLWNKINEVPDSEIWALRQKLRKNLFIYIRRRLMNNLQNKQESPKLLLERLEKINDNALTIGFARRFATYKRAHLIFRNLNRLAAIVNNKDKPVQFIFSGKAHPSDKAGQDLIKRIVEISRMPEFIGRIIFLEDYDMDLAKMLIQGVDVWLNNPTRPLEASGTSGEKAIMNGVVNCSVLDGWWAEGYVPGAGWAIKEERTYQNQELQDELDAETMYQLFEQELVPAYYTRNEQNIPPTWVSHIKNTISQIVPNFTMRRMVNDYFERFYNPLFAKREQIAANNYEPAKVLAAWKQRILRSWDSIEVVSVEIPDSTDKPLKLNDKFKARIVLNLHELNSEEIGVEIVFGQKEFDEVKEILFIEEMLCEGISNKCNEYTCEIPVVNSGVYDYSFRIYPRHPLLKYRQDFSLIKWI